MASDPGPWGGPQPDEPPPQPRVPRHRRWIWLALIALFAGAIWWLAHTFPGGLQTPQDWGWLGYAIVFMAMLSAGLLTARRIDWGQKARHAAIWVAVLAVLVIGVAFRSELEGVGQRVRMVFSGAYPVAAGREIIVPQQDNGGFYVMAKVNGQPVRFLVDTGSSDTVLSPSDAHRLGLDSPGQTFSRMAETANGTGYGAPITAASLSVGSIEITQMPMVINQAPMSMSLLGMSFLGRLDSFQVRERRLYLKPRS